MDSMMDWIICNYCSNYIKNAKSFTMSQCGHLFCERCASICESKCPQCGEINPPTISSSDATNFQKVNKLFDSQIDLMDRLFNAQSLREHQLKVLINNTNSLMNNYQNIKKDYVKNAAEFKDKSKQYSESKLKLIKIISRIQELKKIQKMKKLQNQHLRHSTPHSSIFKPIMNLPINNMIPERMGRIEKSYFHAPQQNIQERKMFVKHDDPFKVPQIPKKYSTASSRSSISSSRISTPDFHYLSDLSN